MNFAGDFFVCGICWGPLSLEKQVLEEQSTEKSIAKFKSDFGSFAAKIHTARIWPRPFVFSEIRGGNAEIVSRYHALRGHEAPAAMAEILRNAMDIALLRFENQRG